MTIPANEPARPGSENEVDSAAAHQRSDDELKWIEDVVRDGSQLSDATRDAVLHQGAGHARLLEAVAYPERYGTDAETVWSRIDRAGGAWPSLLRESNEWRDAEQKANQRRNPRWKRWVLRGLMGVALVIPGLVVPQLLVADQYEEAANLFLLSPSLFAATSLVAAARLSAWQRWVLRPSLVVVSGIYAAFFFTDPQIGAFTASLSIGGVVFAVVVDVCTEQLPVKSRSKRASLVAGPTASTQAPLPVPDAAEPPVPTSTVDTQDGEDDSVDGPAAVDGEARAVSSSRPAPPVHDGADGLSHR